MATKQTQAIVRQQHIIDATDLPLGRLAVRVATLLRGKHKPSYEPHKDEGDVVVVTNISKVTFSGKKMVQKQYHSYSGYPGGLKTKSLAELFAKQPDEVLRRAVREMLPNNRLRNGIVKRLIIK